MTIDATLHQLAQTVQCDESFVAQAPAGLGVDLVRKRVDDRVDVRRDVQSAPLHVVTDIDDGGHIGGRNGADQAFEKARRADPAGQHDVGLARGRYVTWHAATLQPGRTTPALPCRPPTR